MILAGSSTANTFWSYIPHVNPLIGLVSMSRRTILGCLFNWNLLWLSGFLDSQFLNGRDHRFRDCQMPGDLSILTKGYGCNQDQFVRTICEKPADRGHFIRIVRRSILD